MTSDPYKKVMQTSFDLIDQAREISLDNPELFDAMFDMILEYQRVSFERLKEAA